MKLIKSALCSLLLVVSACSSEKADKRWRNDLANQTINGVKNPYMTESKVYVYHAVNSDHRQGKTPTILCSYGIFMLNEKAQQKKDLLTYLRSVNPQTEIIKVDDQKTISMWMPLSEIKPDYFNQFSDDTFRFDRFQECQNFLAVNKPASQTEFAKKYNLKAVERYQVDEKTAQEMKADFSQVVTNPNTLVKLELWCSANFVYFYDTQRDFFLRLDFSVPEKSSNPKCP